MKITEEHLIREHKGIDKKEYRRLGGRTYSQFAKDIKKGNRDEKIIIDRYLKFHERNKTKKSIVIDNGVDNTGNFLDIKKVNANADFTIDGQLYEVKSIKYELNRFRLKLNLLKSYLRQGASVILVLGWATDNPIFTVLHKREIQHIIDSGEKVISGDWEGKPTVSVYKKNYIWHKLPESEEGEDSQDKLS